MPLLSSPSKNENNWKSKNKNKKTKKIEEETILGRDGYMPTNDPIHDFRITG